MPCNIGANGNRYHVSSRVNHTGVANVDQATCFTEIAEVAQRKCRTSVFCEFAQMCLFLSYNCFI